MTALAENLERLEERIGQACRAARRGRGEVELMAVSKTYPAATLLEAARAAELFDAVDSVDSLRLAEKLNEAAGKLGKRLPVLIEVKLSTEDTKAGLEPDSVEASELVERLPGMEHLEARGLMTIAPWGVAEDVTRACFRSLREWRDRWAEAHPGLRFDVLSMGMSGDFALAIDEGATRIRVGTALFGKRQPWTGPE
jgi:pyridoxal phosphate enzyme (YggS family)